MCLWFLGIWFSTFDFDLSHRIEFLPCGRVIHDLTTRLTKSVFESDNFQRRSAGSCDYSGWRQRGVMRGPSVGALSARFNPEHQVSKIGHMDFSILGHVTFRVISSDFSETAMRGECPVQVNSIRLFPVWQISPEFALDFTFIYRQISTSFWIIGSQLISIISFNMHLSAPGNSFFTNCLIYENAVSRNRIDELRSSDGIMPYLLTFDSHMCSTYLSLWLDSSSWITFCGQLIIDWKSQLVDTTTSWCTERDICDGVCKRRKIVENHQKCQSVLVFSARLELLSQVSENDRITFVL